MITLQGIPFLSFKSMTVHHRILTCSLFFILFFLATGQASGETPSLSWSPNADADYYIVYVRSAGSSEYTQVSDNIPAATTAYPLKANTGGPLHYYAVKAFNLHGNSSDFSDETATTHIPLNAQATTHPIADTPSDPGAYEPITIEIILPVDGDTGIAGNIIELSANVYKGDSLSMGYIVNWTSTIDGYLGTGLDINATLSAGIHTLTAGTTDEEGVTATHTILVFVEGKNTAPIVKITGNKSGASDARGQAFEFKGSATDAEDGDLSKTIAWSSNRDGSLGTGSLIKTTLSPGAHTVTAKVADSKAATKTTSVIVTAVAYNAPPVLSIVEIRKGSQTQSGLVVYLFGNASDPEDGNLSDKISWSSNISGILGKGARITVTLIPGNHTITITATASKGRVGSTSTSCYVPPYNNPPVITLGAINPGALEKDGQDYGLSAGASDTEDGNISSFITWESSVNGYLGTGARITPCLSSGEHMITVYVTDSKGKTASKTIEISVGKFNTSPVLTLATPTLGTAGSKSQGCSFSGTAKDAEDGNLSAYITWTSNINGNLGTGSSITTSLSAGTHIISASVNDRQGKSTVRTLSVVIAAYNNSPGVSISSVKAGAISSSGQSFEFSGTASDKEDGNLNARITWTSSRSGKLGSGPTIKAALSAGSHTITAQVVDNQGKSASSTRSVTAEAYNKPPSVTIQSAIPGTFTPSGQSFKFTGTATDAEDGNLNASIAWSSSINGVLGKGATLSKTLSTGKHVITARITDSKGKVASATRAVTVGTNNSTPSLTAIDYLKGSSTLNGQTYTFSSSANDKEDGDISQNITWTSNISGNLGSGASIQAILTAGSHTITAKAADSQGKAGQVSRFLDVQWANSAPSVQILQTTAGAAGKGGQVYELSGTAVDEEEGNVAHTLAWTSSLEGNLGKGNKVLSILRPGQHTITATASDSKGKSAKTSRTVSVEKFNSAPDLDILTAIGSTQNTKGQVFEFSAEASDDTEGNISSRVVWTSDRDGNLGHGSRVKTRLSHGQQTITAKVSDKQGKDNTKSINVSSLREARLTLQATTRSLYNFKLVTLSWKGGSSGVTIYKNNKKIGSGANEDSRIYWYRGKAKFKVCDGAGLKCSAVKSVE